MAEPTTVPRTEFIAATTQPHSGLIRVAYREDSAGLEFFVTFWAVPDGFRIYTVYPGSEDYLRRSYDDHAAACAAYHALLDASREPRCDDDEQ